MKRCRFLAVFAPLVLAAPAIAAEAATPADHAALAQCLDKARSSGKESETCIGTIYDRCTAAPDGSTTLGMRVCADRETSAWDKRLNEAYATALKTYGDTTDSPKGGGPPLKGSDILRDAQRAWLAFRDKKCGAAALPMAGGTGGPLSADICFMHETGRQAAWLEDLTRP